MLDHDVSQGQNSLIATAWDSQLPSMSLIYTLVLEHTVQVSMKPGTDVCNIIVFCTYQNSHEMPIKLATPQAYSKS